MDMKYGRDVQTPILLDLSENKDLDKGNDEWSIWGRLINIQTHFNLINYLLKWINKILSLGMSKPQMKLCKYIWDKIIHWEGCYTLHHTKLSINKSVRVCVCVLERERVKYILKL